jgi:hypothetical protein
MTGLHDRPLVQAVVNNLIERSASVDDPEPMYRKPNLK